MNTENNIPKLPTKVHREVSIVVNDAKASAMVRVAMDQRGVAIRPLALGMGVSKSTVGHLMTGESGWNEQSWQSAWAFLNAQPVK